MRQVITVGLREKVIFEQRCVGGEERAGVSREQRSRYW